MSNSTLHDAGFPLMDRYCRSTYHVTVSSFEPTVPGYRIPDYYGIHRAMVVVGDYKRDVADAQKLVDNGDPGIGTYRIVFTPFTLLKETRSVPLLDGWGHVAIDEREARVITKPEAFKYQERDLVAELQILAAIAGAQQRAQKLSRAKAESAPLASSYRQLKLTGDEVARVVEAVRRESGDPFSVAKEARVKRRLLMHDLRLGIDGIQYDARTDTITAAEAAGATA